jgi:hypothetical protein
MNSPWTARDFASAMLTALESHSSKKFVKYEQERVLFNGFWRGGDSQNVCLWLDKATWHDAKTGEGGDCKEFAKIAFNMSLPEFMERFGRESKRLGEVIYLKEAFDGPKKLTKAVDSIWLDLQKNDRNRPDLAAAWLSDKRGFNSPRQLIGSGFANLALEDLDLFEPQHQQLIKQRLAISPQIIAPLRGVKSEEVQNLFFRSIGNCPKEEKSRLLSGAGGWSEQDGSPRAFGFPHLIHDFPNLVLCEGMADYFAAECLLGDEHIYLPIGATSASALPKWADWLIHAKYPGRVIIINQWDENRLGQISNEAVGPSKAVQALALLKKAGLKANLFNWCLYLENTSTHPSEIKDLADSLKAEASYQECGPHHLNYCFLMSLQEQGKD